MRYVVETDRDRVLDVTNFMTIFGRLTDDRSEAVTAVVKVSEDQHEVIDTDCVLVHPVH